MKHVVKQFAEAVAGMYLVKAENGYAPRHELEAFARLLTSIDWSVEPKAAPPPGSIAGLRHLQTALAEACRAGDCPVLDALRLCIGLTPWETYYARSDWSHPFLDDFASGELIGPSGFVESDEVSLGLFVLGPNTTYTEHAHASTELYYLLGGNATWRLDRPDNTRTYAAGDLVFTTPHQRHEIQTGDTPMLAAFTWKASPAARSYHFSNGPWLDGEPVEPRLVNRADQVAA